MGLKNLRDTRIFDPAKNPPRIVERPAANGTFTREKVPNLLHRKMLNRGGHVVFYPLADHTTQRSPRNDMGQRYMDKAEAKGLIPYGECPMRNYSFRFLPAAVRSLEHNCDPTEFGRGRKFGEHQCCPHVDAMVKIRQNAEARRSAELEERSKNFAQRKEEQQAKQFEQLQSMMAAHLGGGANAEALMAQLRAQVVEQIRSEFEQVSPPPPPPTPGSDSDDLIAAADDVEFEDDIDDDSQE